MKDAWLAMIEELKGGGEVIIIPDGPKGPDRKLKMGCVRLAADTGAAILPFSFTTNKKKILKSWDRFLMFPPFARVLCAYGEPIEIHGRAMFHSDSRGPTIDRWDFDPATGMVGSRTAIRTLNDKLGRPDGGACDVAGGYWSAGVSASCLNRFDRDGNLGLRIDLPEPRPTMPCFGGPDMQTLFVTSARHGLNETMLARFPDAGRLLMLRVAVAGVPVQRFADA